MCVGGKRERERRKKRVREKDEEREREQERAHPAASIQCFPAASFLPVPLPSLSLSPIRGPTTDNEGRHTKEGSREREREEFGQTQLRKFCSNSAKKGDRNFQHFLAGQRRSC